MADRDDETPMVDEPDSTDTLRTSEINVQLGGHGRGVARQRTTERGRGRGRGSSPTVVRIADDQLEGLADAVALRLAAQGRGGALMRGRRHGGASAAQSEGPVASADLSTSVFLGYKDVAPQLWPLEDIKAPYHCFPERVQLYVNMVVISFMHREHCIVEWFDDTSADEPENEPVQEDTSTPADTAAGGTLTADEGREERLRERRLAAARASAFGDEN